MDQVNLEKCSDNQHRWNLSVCTTFRKLSPHPLYTAALPLKTPELAYPAGGLHRYWPLLRWERHIVRPEESIASIPSKWSANATSHVFSLACERPFVRRYFSFKWSDGSVDLNRILLSLAEWRGSTRLERQVVCSWTNHHKHRQDGIDGVKCHFL